MPANYDNIREENIIEYGKGTRHISYLSRLYSDRTHFIFELLQNAEDAGASRILFNLFNDRLEVTHNGRTFNEMDVRGICGVGEGTKEEDLTKIGKFGIGFKSVHAYTATPEIYSGEEAFKIEKFIRPYAIPGKPISNSFTTTFVFPFNSDEIEPESACEEIGARLRNLSARTLLFLRKINEIEYKLPNSTGGVYMREEIPRGSARQVCVIGQNNNKEEEENWLVFGRTVPLPEKKESINVEVSFRLETGDNSERIVKITDSPLVVFFPTEKATNLGFLIQGPYRTTPSRDNIPKDEEWNETLIKETAELLEDVLTEIKKFGLLSTSFLQALPIKSEDFPEDSMFYPIYKSVRNALRNEELLPSDDGSFASASNSRLASAAWLRKLFRQNQLNQLYQKNLKWIHGNITDRLQYDLWRYFKFELNIDELTPDAVVRKLDSSFFDEQSDEWMIEFYSQLPNQRALWRKGSGSYWDPDGSLRNKAFIRLQDGSHIKPFDGDKPNVYLPTKRYVNTELPTVKIELANHDRVREFLASDLLIPEFDIVAEVIENVLPKYKIEPLPSKEEHQSDIGKIIESFNVDSQEKQNRLKNSLKNTSFILSHLPNSDEESYRKPVSLYFLNDSLELYFSGNNEVSFVSKSYAKPALDIFSKLGVSSEVRVDCVKWNHSREYIDLGYKTNHRRGVGGFDPDIRVEGLSHALTTPSFEKSKFIWNELCLPYSHCIRGKVIISSRRDFSRNASVYKEEELISDAFGQLLMGLSWLPTVNNDFRKPSETRLDELPEGFKQDEKLVDLLGMKKDVVTKLAQEVGLSPDILEFARKNPLEIEKLIAKQESKTNTAFPTRRVINPERRQERLNNQLTDASNKEYHKRTRSVRTTNSTIDPYTWLRNQYTNKYDQMVCQICKEEMPFLKRDGTYYFEKKEVLSRNYLPKEHEAQYLALCPTCAAKFDEFIKTDDEAMNKLKNNITNTEDSEILISLGDEKTSIRFVETHYHDLKAIIKKDE